MSLHRSALVALIVLSLSCVRTAYAGFGYAVCVSVCSAACAGPSLTTGPMAPGAWSACISACATTGCAAAAATCFANTTTITAVDPADGNRRQVVPIAEVRPGMLVQTLLDTHSTPTPAVTRVTRNVRLESSFDFVKLTVATTALRVTLDHTVIVVRNGTLVADRAAHVISGDEMLLAFPDRTARATVLEAVKERRQSKYVLETESGTVVADGVFVTTMCGEMLNQQRTNLLSPQIKQWQESHQPQLKP